MECRLPEADAESFVFDSAFFRLGGRKWGLRDFVATHSGDGARKRLLGRYGHEFRALFLSGESGVILNQQSPWHSVLKQAACQAAVNPGAIQVTWRKRVPLAGTSPPSDYSTTTNKYLLESGRVLPAERRPLRRLRWAVKPPRKIY